MCWKLQSGKDDYVGLVMYNTWKTPKERNKHSSGLLMKEEMKVDHALAGETPMNTEHGMGRRLC